MIRLVLLPILLLLSTGSFAQIGSRELLCGKKWYPYKMKEADGTMEKLPAEYHSAYTRFNCDGTIESIEIDPKRMLVKGTWSYNSSTHAVTATQTSYPDFPTATYINKVIRLTKDEMAFQALDKGGGRITLYFSHTP